MMGAVKGRQGWTDTQLARKIGCSERTVRNMKADPTRTRYETVMKLIDLYTRTCEGVRT